MLKGNNDKHQNDVSYVVLVFLLLTWNIFHTLYYCFYCRIWTSKCQLGCFLIHFKITFVIQIYISTDLV